VTDPSLRQVEKPEQGRALDGHRRGFLLRFAHRGDLRDLVGRFLDRLDWPLDHAQLNFDPAQLGGSDIHPPLHRLGELQGERAERREHGHDDDGSGRDLRNPDPRKRGDGRSEQQGQHGREQDREQQRGRNVQRERDCEEHERPGRRANRTHVQRVRRRGRRGKRRRLALEFRNRLHA
jgi:hypothetical protein